MSSPVYCIKRGAGQTKMMHACQLQLQGSKKDTGMSLVSEQFYICYIMQDVICLSFQSLDETCTYNNGTYNHGTYNHAPSPKLICMGMF